MSEHESLFRWFALGVFLAAFGISAHRRMKARRSAGTIARSRESLPLIAGRLVVALPLFGGVVVYLAHPSWMTWASLDLPGWARWLGVGLGIAVVPSVHWVLTHLGTNVSETVLTKQEHRLITSGPYRWVRHPLYTTGIALFTSIGLMAANWWVLGWAAIALLAVRSVVIPREEAHLEAKFGKAYAQYRGGTGALWPSFRRNRRHGVQD